MASTSPGAASGGFACVRVSGGKGLDSRSCVRGGRGGRGWRSGRGWRGCAAGAAGVQGAASSRHLEPDNPLHSVALRPPN